MKCGGLQLLCIACLLASGCSAWVQPVAPDYERTLTESKRLMADGRLRTACDRLSALWQLDASRPDAGHWLGECQFRLRELRAAVRQFEAVLEVHPAHHASRQRRWAALIAIDRGFRGRLRPEVDEFAQSHWDQPGALFAAYQGYGYLQRRADAVAALERAASLAEDHTLRFAIAGELVEQIIAARGDKLQHRLAGLYLRRFPGQRGVRLVTRVLLRSLPATVDVAGSRALLRQYPENRHLRQLLAADWIRRGVADPDAEAWLESHLQAWRAAADREGQHYIDADVWRVLRGWEAAETYFWLGVLRRHQDQPAEAKSLLQRALASHAEAWRVHQQLYELALHAGQVDQAIAALQASLAGGNRRATALSQLRTLLAQRHGYRGPPHRFFAARRGVVTFSDATGSGLQGIRSQRVAWGDYDNDGDDDLLLDGPRLFRNDDGLVFVEVTSVLGLERIRASHGGIWGDFNNDGYVDLFLTRRQGNRLLENLDGKGFRDISEQALAAVDRQPMRTEAAAWGDFDNDGWLDLYLANYEGAGVERGFCDPDRLLRNGGRGEFVDASAAVGVVLEAPLCGRGVIWSDLNADGAQDIVVSNYRLHRNSVWLNTNAGGFRQAAAELGIRGMGTRQVPGHTIGSVAGDIDNDGDLDLYMTNLVHPRYLDYSDGSRLWVNELSEAGVFRDRHGRSGIGYEETNADPVLFDADNDGDLDLFVTSVYPGRFSRLLLNDGTGRYKDVSWLSGAGIENGWGVAASDYDRDGDIDLAVASRGGVTLLRNDGNANHWLSVSVRSPNCNRFGIGARVRVEYAGRAQLREIAAGRGTGSQDSVLAHFGFGRYNGEVAVTVDDLCGAEIRRIIPQANRVLVFK